MRCVSRRVVTSHSRLPMDHIAVNTITVHVNVLSEMSNQDTTTRRKALSHATRQLDPFIHSVRTWMPATRSLVAVGLRTVPSLL